MTVHVYPAPISKPKQTNNLMLQENQKFRLKSDFRNNFFFTYLRFTFSSENHSLPRVSCAVRTTRVCEACVTCPLVRECSENIPYYKIHAHTVHSFTAL